MTPVVRLNAQGPAVLIYRPPDMAEIAWWQQTIHPKIVRKFGPPFDGWRWPLNAGLCMNIPRGRGSRLTTRIFPRLLPSWARAANFTYEGVALYHRDKPALPLGLAIFLPATENLRPNGPGILYLEWFSARPAGTHPHRNNVGLGQYLMDWLISRSLKAGLDGRVSLHAATDGLRRVYEKWGFQPIAATDPLIRNRRNNGLFYELQPDAALAFRHRLDHLR